MKTFRVEQWRIVMSVITRPGWWEGRCWCREVGRMRRRESRRKRVVKIRRVAVKSLAHKRT